MKTVAANVATDNKDEIVEDDDELDEGGPTSDPSSVQIGGAKIISSALYSQSSDGEDKLDHSMSAVSPRIHGGHEVDSGGEDSKSK